MQTLWQRVNLMATVALSVTTTTTCALAFSTAYFEWWQGLPKPHATVALGQVHRLWLDPRSGYETAMVSVKVDADLSGLWHWNVKQLFAFVTAEFHTPHPQPVGRFNEVVLWDQVIASADTAKLHLGFDRPLFENFVVDKGQGLKGNNITLRLKWNVMPHTGYLYFQEGPPSTFRIPPEMPHSQPAQGGPHGVHRRFGAGTRIQQPG